MHDDERTPSPNPESNGGSFLPPNWTELKPLLDELLDTPAQHRAIRLGELSRGDSALERRLQQLLAEAQRDMPLLGGPVAQRFDALANTSTPALPEVLAGRYRVGRDWAVAGSRSCT